VHKTHSVRFWWTLLVIPNFLLQSFSLQWFFRLKNTGMGARHFKTEDSAGKGETGRGHTEHDRGIHPGQMLTLNRSCPGLVCSKNRATNLCPHTHAHTRTHTRTHMHSYTHKCAYLLEYKPTHTHTLTHTHTCIHTLMHVCRSVGPQIQGSQIQDPRTVLCCSHMVSWSPSLAHCPCPCCSPSLSGGARDGGVSKRPITVPYLETIEFRSLCVRTCVYLYVNPSNLQIIKGDDLSHTAGTVTGYCTSALNSFLFESVVLTDSISLLKSI